MESPTNPNPMVAELIEKIHKFNLRIFCTEESEEGKPE